MSITVEEEVSNIQVAEQEIVVTEDQHSVFVEDGEVIELFLDQTKICVESNPLELKAEEPILKVYPSEGGSQGPQGPAGDTRKISNIYTAADTVGGLRAAYTDSNGEVLHADSTNLTHCGRVAGVSLHSAIAGQSVSIVAEGILEDPSFNFTPGATLFFNSLGLLVESAVGASFFQPIGRAETSTRIFIDIAEPIAL